MAVLVAHMGGDDMQANQVGRNIGVHGEDRVMEADIVAVGTRWKNLYWQKQYLDDCMLSSEDRQSPLCETEDTDVAEDKIDDEPSLVEESAGGDFRCEAKAWGDLLCKTSSFRDQRTNVLDEIGHGHVLRSFLSTCQSHPLLTFSNPMLLVLKQCCGPQRLEKVCEALLHAAESCGLTSGAYERGSHAVNDELRITQYILFEL